MSVNDLTERDHLTIELALIIEDPAGIEQLDLAAVIIELFANRSARQCELMRQSLWRWAQQWPRALSAAEAAERPPPTERNVCGSCGGSGVVTKYIRPGVTGEVPCTLCRTSKI
jgi:hypothetical protein